jgi:hypothetical protein
MVLTLTLGGVVQNAAGSEECVVHCNDRPMGRERSPTATRSAQYVSAVVGSVRMRARGGAR